MTAPTNPTRRLASTALLLLAQPMLAAGASAQQSYLQPPATTDEAARCDYFSRLHRFAEQSKALCDEDRQVKPGPVTTRILAECRASQGDRLDQAPVGDLMAKLSAQIQGQGVGYACHEVSIQVWDLVGQ